MQQPTGTRSFYLSYLLGTRLVLPGGRKGRLVEVVAEAGENPRIRSFVVHTPSGKREFPWSSLELKKIESGHYTLSARDEGAAPAEPLEGEIRLKKHLLDRQIVDLDGAKVVRVNDVRLAHVREGLFLVAVDVSFTALLRRLGLELIGRKLAPGRLLPRYIPWSEVQAFVPHGGAVKLASSSERLKTLHPSELADIIENLDAATQVAILDALGQESVVDVLEEMEPDAQVDLLQRMGAEKAADVLEQMDADEAADIIEELPAEQAEDILSQMDGDAREEVRELMEYPDHQVGSLMSTEYLSFPETSTADEVLQALRRESVDHEHMLAVFALDHRGKLSGVVPLPELVLASASAPLSELGMERLVSVRDEEPIREVVQILSKYRSLSVPVVDADGSLVGAVTVDDVLDDLLRAGGSRLRG
jgi:CBS domain-containing protein